MDPTKKLFASQQQRENIRLPTSCSIQHQLPVLPANKCNHCHILLFTRAILFPLVDRRSIDPVHRVVKIQPNLKLY